MAVLLAEHRLERCLAAADRVLAFDSGSLAFDGPPSDFLAWSLRADPALATPGARLLEGVGLPAPASVREARRSLSARGVELSAPERPLARVPGDAASAGSSASAAADQTRTRPRYASDLWIELGEGDERTEALRGVELEIAAGARRPDGAERRREAPSCVPRRGSQNPVAGESRQPAGWPSCPSGRGPVHARAHRRRVARRRGRRCASPLRPRGSHRRRPARPLRRGAAAARPGDRRRGTWSR